MSSSLNQHVGRTLLQASAADDKEPIIFNNTAGLPCIMLWAQSLSIKPPGSQEPIDLPIENATTNGSMCSNTASE